MPLEATRPRVSEAYPTSPREEAAGIDPEAVHAGSYSATANSAPIVGVASVNIGQTVGIVGAAVRDQPSR